MIVPVTYINSAANLKAFVGEKGGTVCTSTNAPTAVRWALTGSPLATEWRTRHGRGTHLPRPGSHPPLRSCSSPTSTWAATRA